MIMSTNSSAGARVALGGLLLAASTLVASDVEDRLTQLYQVKPGGKLAVEADRGSIEVKSADADQVAIEVLRKVSGESRARSEEVLKNLERQRQKPSGALPDFGSEEVQRRSQDRWREHQGG